MSHIKTWTLFQANYMCGGHEQNGIFTDYSAFLVQRTGMETVKQLERSARKQCLLRSDGQAQTNLKENVQVASIFVPADAGPQLTAIDNPNQQLDMCGVTNLFCSD